ncbi:hypothetical protein KR100_09060 [Synechococcus sp. KORDI-100]|nr:hypothetical protein KR100_09060 [Synechococcus sp. KORDI-100]
MGLVTQEAHHRTLVADQSSAQISCFQILKVEQPKISSSLKR